MKRRNFMEATAVAGMALATQRTLANEPKSVINVGVIGCGSVSEKYLPHLKNCPFAKIVSVCDKRADRANKASKLYAVPNRFSNVEAMLQGPSFDLFVNLTDMQEHYRLNKQALEAGRNVWSEKPLANSLEQAEELVDLSRKKGVRIWGAPTVILSPQFAFMAKTLNAQTLGKVAMAFASYGHLGPTWSAFFYEAGGGTLFDLGVYNIATLTALLGPVKYVVAMTSIVTAERTVQDKGKINVAAEDNAAVTMDHGNGVLSTIHSGFNFFTPFDHASGAQNHHTLSITGTKGSMHLAGYDWAPHAVELATLGKQKLVRHAQEKGDYVWQNGASYIAECLAKRQEPLLKIEHTLHVLEIMVAARKSQLTGARVPLRSSFAWPMTLEPVTA